MSGFVADPTYREVPRNIEAEQALLGAILVNNEAHDRVSGFLEPEHFYDQLHRQIYETAATLIGAGKQATPITLKTFFESAEPVGAVTVPAYLGQLAANATTIINVRDYARTIYDLATRRLLIVIGEDMVNAAYDSPVDFPPKEQIEEAETRLFSLAERGVGYGGAVSARVVLDEEIDRINEAYKHQGPIGVPTALVDLDRKLGGGLQLSDLLIVAGRPSMGKSALATSVTDGVNVPTIFFSLEMSKGQIVQRMLSAATGFPTEKLRRGDLTEREWRILMDAKAAIDQRLQKCDLIIDDTAAISLPQLRTRARRAKRKDNIGLVVVDYLQLITTGSSRRDGRVQEVSEITGALKALAKELNVPVLALSQLSRAVEAREDKRPRLADLRESGSIEQDADVVMFVFRDEYYVERQRPAPNTPEFNDWTAKMEAVSGKAEVIIGKARHGPVGTVELHFDDTTTRFSNLARSGHAQEGRS